jgi:hypothetical protein
MIHSIWGGRFFIQKGRMDKNTVGSKSEIDRPQGRASIHWTFVLELRGLW